MFPMTRSIVALGFLLSTTCALAQLCPPCPQGDVFLAAEVTSGAGGGRVLTNGLETLLVQPVSGQSRPRITLQAALMIVGLNRTIVSSFLLTTEERVRYAGAGFFCTGLRARGWEDPGGTIDIQLPGDIVRTLEINRPSFFCVNPVQDRRLVCFGVRGVTQPVPPGLPVDTDRVEDLCVQLP
jgi:hypothetical protein